MPRASVSCYWDHFELYSPACAETSCPIILKLLCSFDVFTLSLCCFYVASATFLMWASQFSEPQCQVITFCLFVSSDLSNIVIFCVIFVIEILYGERKSNIK